MKDSVQEMLGINRANLGLETGIHDFNLGYVYKTFTLPIKCNEFTDFEMTKCQYGLFKVRYQLLPK